MPKKCVVFAENQLKIRALTLLSTLRSNFKSTENDFVQLCSRPQVKTDETVYITVVCSLLSFISSIKKTEEG